MRLLRTLLLLLVSVALPLYAGASARAAVPCPMMHAAGAAMDAADDEAPAADCCEDANLGSTGGPACKAGADCQTASVPLAATAPGAEMPVAEASLRPQARPPRASAAAADIWRPPAALGL